MQAMIKLLVVLLSTQLLIKEASSDWVLGVEIVNFTNSFNVEIRDQKYCCCEMQNSCNIGNTESDPTFPQNCAMKCDPTYFVVNLLDDVENTDDTIANVSIFYKKAIIKFGSLVFQVPVGSSTTNQSGLEIQAWDDDHGIGTTTGDDLMDSIIIPTMDTTNDIELSKLQTLQGEHGIGNFTLIFYNLTHDPNPCDSCSAPVYMYNSSSTVPQGCTSQTLPLTTTVLISSSSINMNPCDSCSAPVSMYHPSSTASQGCTSQVLLVTTTVVISSSSTIPSSIVDEQTPDEEMTVVVVLLAVVSTILVITSIALGATLNCLRKHKNSVPASKLTESKELSTMTAASSDDVRNPTYDPANPTSHNDDVEFDYLYSTVNKKGKVSEKGSQNIGKVVPSMSAAGSTRVMDNPSTATYDEIVDDEAAHVYSSVNKRSRFAKSSSHHQQDHSTNKEVVAIYALAGTGEP